jgi:hypothetical protein
MASKSIARIVTKLGHFFENLKISIIQVEEKRENQGSFVIGWVPTISTAFNFPSQLRAIILAFRHWLRNLLPLTGKISSSFKIILMVNRFCINGVRKKL